MDWLTGLVAALLSRLVAYLVTRGMEYAESQREKKLSEREIDERLKKLKSAYKKAFDGQPVTPEQRDQLKSAIRDFIHNNDSGGL